MNKCNSFLPSIDKNSRVLILGSMPGIASLNEQQYYAHPQNRFWKVLGNICNEKNLQNYNYQEKLKILLQNKIALWDTIGYCERAGSLDTNITKEKPNDILGLLKSYPNIKTIFLNGTKSYTILKKYFPDILQKYNCIKMPSTSPANAKYTLELLIQEWSQLKHQ